MRKSEPNSDSSSQPLWTRDFTIITIGSIISMLGNAMSGFAMSLMILDISQSTLLYAIFIAVYTLPQIIMPIFSGAVLDRFSRKKTIYTLDFISATQSYVPDEKKGRFNGVFNMINTVGSLIGEIGAGLLTLLLPERLVLMSAMLVCVAAAIVIMGGTGSMWRRSITGIKKRSLFPIYGFPFYAIIQKS